jgi:RHS repeat-associated protein
MFDPYGKVTVLDGNGTPRTVNESLYGNPWTFTGRRLDGETGLMQFRARMYDTGLGRFISRDPIDTVETRSYIGAFSYAYAIADHVDGFERSWELAILGTATPVSFAWLLDLEPSYSYLRGKVSSGRDPMGLCDPPSPSQVCDKANLGKRIVTNCFEDCCLEYCVLSGSGGFFHMRIGTVLCVRWGMRERTRGFTCGRTRFGTSFHYWYIWEPDLFSWPGKCSDTMTVAMGE